MLDHELMGSVAEQLINGTTVRLRGKILPVKRSSYQRLKMLEFEMDGNRYQAIEQNPEKPSRWGKLAQQGRRVVQFRDMESGKYVAVAVDGQVKEYSR